MPSSERSEDWGEGLRLRPLTARDDLTARREALLKRQAEETRQRLAETYADLHERFEVAFDAALVLGLECVKFHDVARIFPQPNSVWVGGPEGWEVIEKVLLPEFERLHYRVQYKRAGWWRVSPHLTVSWTWADA